MPATSIDLLRSVPLFGGMTDSAVEAIRQLVETEDFEAGEALTRQGEPGDRFFVLASGQASVEQDGIFIRELRPATSWARSPSSTSGPGPPRSSPRSPSTRWSSVAMPSGPCSTTIRPSATQ